MTLRTAASNADTNAANGPGSRSSPHNPNVGAIAGGAVGAVVAVALGFLGAAMLRRHRQGILRFFSHLKSPSTSASTLGEGRTPAELMEHSQVNNRSRLCAGELPADMEHSQVNRSRLCARELPAEEVAREMDAGP